MAYDETVADRVRAALAAHPRVEEKRMFGGLAFMLAGRMAVGVLNEELMVRVGPDTYAKALARPHARAMDFTGRPLRGFVYVAGAGFRTAADLRRWVDLAVAFAESQPARARAGAGRASSRTSRSRGPRPKPTPKPRRPGTSRLRRSRGS